MTEYEIWKKKQKLKKKKQQQQQQQQQQQKTAISRMLLSRQPQGVTSVQGWWRKQKEWYTTYP